MAGIRIGAATTPWRQSGHVVGCPCRACWHAMLKGTSRKYSRPSGVGLPILAQTGDQLALRPLGALPFLRDPATLDGETVATAISLVTLVAHAGVAGAAHRDDPVVKLQDVEVFSARMH